MTGITSRRPSHIRIVIATVETSENASNDPVGPASPSPGPTLLIIEAEDAITSVIESEGPWAAVSIAITAAPTTKMPEVEEDERRHRAKRALVDRRRR